VPKREHDELQAKLRILEARRAEDRERLRDVDKLKEEAEEWLKVKEKSKGTVEHSLLLRHPRGG
jgi:dynactin 1